jgi:hypothetical protein
MKRANRPRKRRKEQALARMMIAMFLALAVLFQIH